MYHFTCTILSLYSAESVLSEKYFSEKVFESFHKSEYADLTCIIFARTCTCNSL